MAQMISMKFQEPREEATEDEIRKAYRKLSRDHHPDKGGDPGIFVKIKTAYETLIDPEKRSNYDKYGADDEMLQSAYGTALQIFERATSNDPGDSESECNRLFKTAKLGTNSEIDYDKKKIDKLNKLLSRIKKTPKNDFIGKNLRGQILTLEDNISIKNNYLKILSMAKGLLDGYVFEVEEKE